MRFQLENSVARPVSAISVRLRQRVARPHTGYHPDLIAGAADLWESLSQNHPLVDGNKHVAVTAMAAFLAAQARHTILTPISRSANSRTSGTPPTRLLEAAGTMNRR